MSGLRKLKRRHDRKYVDTVAKIASRYNRKLSDVLLELAKPLLTTARTEEDFRTDVETAILGWNLSFLPADKRATFLRDSMDSLPGGREDLPVEAEQCLQMLVARKQALFPDDRRIVVDHQISGGPRDGNLVVTYEIARK